MPQFNKASSTDNISRGSDPLSSRPVVAVNDESSVKRDVEGVNARRAIQCVLVVTVLGMRI
jgi:hypothetical protein